MKILAVEKELPSATAEKYQPHLIAEARRAWDLYQAGIIRELYFTQDDKTAVLILECSGAEEARQVLNSLPLVKAGLIDFVIQPLIPYSGFQRLFEAGSLVWDSQGVNNG